MRDVALLRRRILGLAGVLLLAAASQGEPYWIAWEGDDWPENQGWTRSYGTFNNPGGGQAERTLEGGALTIDGVQGIGVYDVNIMDLPGTLNPNVGEEFVARWRMRTDAVAAPYLRDPMVSFVSDDQWIALFVYSLNSVWEISENVEVHVSSGLLHEYEFRSKDMRSYTFSIDGKIAIRGGFNPSVVASRVAWGDGFTPSESRSSWDRFEFGVVPESTSSVLVVVTVALVRTRMKEVIK